ncbi:MAG: response regulator transcription factor [Acidimicrobiia bacterium]|nr:response regulator transcription factor [Acidimicrobiia bacterium]
MSPYSVRVSSVATPVRSILVIEDEPPIADAVAARLRSEGYMVETAYDGLSGVERCNAMQPDLVVLDLMLPGLDGIEVCKRIQMDRPVPVLMLTARDTEQDLVLGLTIGADDYLTKPFSARELVARVNALLRRVDLERSHDGPSTSEVGVIKIGRIELDLATRKVHVGEKVIHLTPTEFDLVAFLAAEPGTVFTREDLFAAVWGYEIASGGRTLDSHVRAVRRKLGDDLIRTVHGVGYAIDAVEGEPAR